MAQQIRHYGISELSEQTSTPISTIKFYLRKNLLPRPLKINKTTAFYTSEHIEKIRLIKKLQQENNISLEAIKEMFGEINGDEAEKEYSQRGKFSRSRAKIIDKAVDIFRTKGYAKTTIDDIVGAAHISNRTFYDNFKNKEVLFMNCFEKIFVDAERKIFSTVTVTKKNHMELFKKAIRVFYKEYPKWSDMMNLLRANAISNPKSFRNKLDEALLLTIDRITYQTETGISERSLRPINSKLAAVMILGMMDYFCHFLSQGKFKESQATLITMFADIVFHGIAAAGGSK